MKTKKRKRGLSFLLAVLVTAACLLTGCSTQKSEAQEDAETIQVYLWNTRCMKITPPTSSRSFRM